MIRSLTIVLAFATSLAAQPRDISGILAPIIKEHQVPGMTAAIIQGNTVTAIGAAGVRKAGDKTKVTTEDKWHLGSCTKAMTATLCGVLVDEDKLRWDQTLGETFPELAESMHADFRTVTLEQLLTNRAGCPANLDRDGLWRSLWGFKGTSTEARAAILSGVTKHPPEHAPGSKFLYSNAGFAIAGHMAEKVTGQSWEDLITSKVFNPLQMFSIGFGPPGTKAGKDKDGKPVIDQPRGHKPGGAAVEPGPGADNPVAIGPAGIVHCTISDWAKFVSLHLRGDPSAKDGAESRLVKADTMARLHSIGTGPDGQPDGTYAMGWVILTRPWAGDPGRVLTHSGSNTMWFCTAWIAPEKDFAVVIACNQGGDVAAKASDKAAGMLIKEASR